MLVTNLGKLAKLTNMDFASLDSWLKILLPWYKHPTLRTPLIYLKICHLVIPKEPWRLRNLASSFARLFVRVRVEPRFLGRRASLGMTMTIPRPLIPDI